MRRIVVCRAAFAERHAVLDPSIMPANAVPAAAPATGDPVRTREVAWPTLALFVVVSTGLLVLLLAVTRASPSSGAAGPPWRQNLVTFVTLLAVAVGGVVFGVGGLRPDDVGLRRDKLAQGLAVTAGVWAVMQLAAAVPDLASAGSVAVARTWARNGVGPTLLWTAAMILGAALYEEVAYRGFLFPQLYLKLSGPHRRRFWTALLVSQALFASSHVPAHIALRNLSGAALWSRVVVQGVAGVLLLLVYLRTRNLWISIGLHGLVNAPTPLVAGATAPRPRWSRS